MAAYQVSQRGMGAGMPHAAQYSQGADRSSQKIALYSSIPEKDPVTLSWPGFKVYSPLGTLSRSTLVSRMAELAGKDPAPYPVLRSHKTWLTPT